MPRKKKAYLTPAIKYLKDSTKRWVSFVNVLREQGKLNEQVETAIHNMTLEDLIAVKLELSSRTQKSPIYAIPLFETLEVIVRDAMLKFAISATRTPSEAAASLGISLEHFRSQMHEFKIYDYIPTKQEMLKRKLVKLSERKN
jgi:hypothetical protein